MDVRPAVPGDASAMARVHVGSWTDAYTGLLPAGLIASLTVEARTEQWLRTLASERIQAWVAETERAVVGICSIGPAQDTPGAGQVYTIYVPGRLWGRGIGSALWREAMSALHRAGYAGAELWVLETNDRARRFHAARGWITDGAVKLDDAFGAPIREVRYRSPEEAPLG